MSKHIDTNTEDLFQDHYVSYVHNIISTVFQLPWEIWTEHKSSHPLSSHFDPEWQKHLLSWELQAQQVFLAK